LRNSIAFKTLAATAAVLVAAAVAVAQDTTQKAAQSARQKPAVNSHKVWTEDDIAALRSPADDYLMQKEAQAAAAALANQRAATNLALQPSLAPKQPSTLEETERAIKDSLEDIQDQKNTLARLNKELDETPEDQRAERAKEIERRTAVLQASQEELKGFQDRRNDLASKAAVASSGGRDVTSASATPSCDAVSAPCS
jgi:chromosome segregation ATPase